jgi:exopolyphosphatase/guanosine-5'-triphosphate,3'-diphosphate pyrophosphatase
VAERSPGGENGERAALYAAVDLGSNSFHLVIAREIAGQFRTIDRLREPVRLAGGLNQRGELSTEIQERALEALGRFGQRLRGMPRDHVRAVGTDALRRAKNGRAFLVKASEELGARIEILPGREEARLIWLGLVHALPANGARRLLADIGGGSTECAIGEGPEPLAADSLAMGCVGGSLQFFADGMLDRERFRAAELAARQELVTIERAYRALGWDEAYGTSGTVTAVAEILRQSGWSEGAITREGLRRLRRACIEVGRAGKLELPGLSPERAPVLAGGVAILRALFETFGLEALAVSEASIRDGVLYDLAGRVRHEDARDRAIRAFSERFHVDLEQSSRVERTALALLRQVARDWELDVEEARQLLSWAARLHECGLALSYSGHHKHGAYLIAHSDLPGFSSEDRAAVAALVQNQRRKLAVDSWAEIAPRRLDAVRRLAVILRLAVLLNRGRGPAAPPPVALRARESTLALGFPPGWLEAHPLTLADLAEETSALREIGLRLTLE